MKIDSLPSGAWESLFPRALALIDEISKYGGIANPFWTLGGGTVLMFRYSHRLSKDIDIFVPDPQYLGFVTPRLSDTAADLTEDYTEQPGMFVKLQFDEGEVDFVSAPNLLMTPGKLGIFEAVPSKLKRLQRSSPRRCITVATVSRRATCLIWRL
jgi:hypothetical protein